MRDTHATHKSEKAIATTYYCMKRNVALEIGPMMSLFQRGGQWRHNNLLRNSTLFYNTIQATCDGISTSLTIRQRQEMTEEQCHRPSDRDAESKRKRITGWLAGHTIHLEIEEWPEFKKNSVNFIASTSIFVLFKYIITLESTNPAMGASL